MIEYVVMDYDGDPMTIEDGEMYNCEPDRGEHWNPATCEFEPDEDDSDDDWDDGSGYDAYGHYHPTIGALDEQRKWFYDGLR